LIYFSAGIHSLHFLTGYHLHPLVWAESVTGTRTRLGKYISPQLTPFVKNGGLGGYDGISDYVLNASIEY
jgi:hypothetical protein